MIDAKNINGQKLVVDTAIDMSDFDGEAIIYAIAAPKNYSEFLNNTELNFWIAESKTFYLSSASNSEEMIENHRNK